MNAQQRYEYCEAQLSTEIQKVGLLVMFQNRYIFHIDYDKLLQEIASSNFFYSNRDFITQLLNTILNSNSQKLTHHILLGDFYLPMIDWELLSKESNVSPILIDLYGYQMNWCELLKHSYIPPVLIEKYSSLFYEALRLLLNN